MNNYLPTLSLILVLIAENAPAQERDLATVNYEISRLQYNDTLANTRQLDVKIRIPLYQKHKSVLGATLGYKNVYLAHFPQGYSPDLHGVIFQGAWLYRLTDCQSFTLFAQAGLFSDMKDIGSKDIRYGTGFRYRFKHSDKLSTGWGLAYSKQFFGNQVVPFIDLDYKPSGKWSISGQFPVKPKLVYHFNNKWSAGMELSGEAASYRLSSTEKNNRFIQINQWTGLLRFEYQLTKSWQLTLGMGKHFKQRYKLYNDAATTPWTIITVPIGRRPEPIYQIAGQGLYVQLGISFTPF